MGVFSALDIRQECEKAAQILNSFMEKKKKKIPKHVIDNAKGIAIFHAFRAGMYFAGASGTGIVVARLSNGSWSLPSAFSIKSGSVGLVYGIDVYDCVCVLNTEAAVEAYSQPELDLSGRLTLAAGPIGGTANAEEVKPVWTYTKSKGLYGGVTIDGTIIKELPEANANFYGIPEITAAQILKGDIATKNEDAESWRLAAAPLLDVLKTTEG